MPLTALALRNARPKKKAYKLGDSGGLFLLVTPSGGKHWRLKYRYGGKEKLLTLGPYPAVTLAEAREERENAKKLLRAGIDPSTHRQELKAAREQEAAETFGRIADEFIAREAQKERSDQTLRKLRWTLEDLARPLWDRPIRQITPAEALRVLRKIEARGLRESARRCRSNMSRVFRYAILTGRADSDPLYALKGDALLPPLVKHHAAVIDRTEVGMMTRAIDALEGSFVVRKALQLLALCYPRPGELRHAEWRDIDFEVRVWTIPAERTKMRGPHKIPLS